ncbi:MAG: putative 4-hydroxybenzoate polyprenyltransferase [Thermodesulfobacteriaceae bacterium]|nr:putative 4-hydroxybenzoate polyprenyltransferase [Thermodesulfobacteriaceae bacterium]MCX8041814.1 putative 4-hydroxybenzoate polyprenyltransferase [Thermodesulfobacteriaceae bacterium]MDW8136191.1 UbiA-like polyprenyltransferase [Thermodesulfobacterium sp.]
MGLKKLKLYSELLKLEHTIFALPFGLSSLWILSKELPSVKSLFFIILALISGRTLGMAFNRLLDKPWDEINPRTKIWPHAQGLVKNWEIKLIIFLSLFFFLFSCSQINKLTLILSPLVVLLLWFYPLAKRIIDYPHLVLGLVYFLIPVAVDIALNEEVSLLAVFLGIAMGTWVAGFDILYSLQDYEFDQKVGLKSLPVKLGISKALKIARFLHLLTLIFLLLLGKFYPKTTWIYYLGLLVISLFLIYEHRLIKENDLSKINKAFFTVNGFISLLFFLLIVFNNWFYSFKLSL